MKKVLSILLALALAAGIAAAGAVSVNAMSGSEWISAGVLLSETFSEWQYVYYDTDKHEWDPDYLAVTSNATFLASQKEIDDYFFYASTFYVNHAGSGTDYETLYQLELRRYIDTLELWADYGLVAPSGTWAFYENAITTPTRYFIVYSGYSSGGPNPELVTGIAENTTVTLSTEAPIRAGYVFNGWTATPGGTTAITSVVMDDYKVVYPIWAPAPTTYTLTYNANNGTGGPAAQTGIAAGTNVTLATTGLPTRTGYTFEGWAATSTGTATITSIAVNANTTVYAVWQQNTVVIDDPDDDDEPETDPIYDFFAAFLPTGVARVLAWIVRYLLFGWLWGRWI